MKVDCIIVLGPSGELHPLVSERAQKFSLPFLNIPLLNLSINYLTPHASRIFVFCLEKHESAVREMIKVCEVSIDVITTGSYEGMAHILSVARSRLQSSHFIMCKGDIYGLEPLRPLLESFVDLDADVYVSIDECLEDGSLMCLDSCNYLRMYGTEEFPFIKNERLNLTTRFSLKDFYIIKTTVLEELHSMPENFYSFKSNIIPHLIRLNKRIKVSENMILQIRSTKDYASQLDLKNSLAGPRCRAYNLIDSSCTIKGGALVEDSIIGEECLVGQGCRIRRSILMNNVEVGPNSTIDSCIVSSGTIIRSCSEIKHCKVGEAYAEHPTTPSFDVLSKE